MLIVSGIYDDKAFNNDWHQADIIAALRKKRTNMSVLSCSVGLSSSTLANVLNSPWPKGEWIVAGALELHPSTIWPSRYFDESGRLLERNTRIEKRQKK
ncbi:helix-turn-helix domain-containing protein [Yersinia pseudotuberculosis]|uniref:helix-turn-helix domain-containing protein n=1 Tax=Yersinia pseudotuberculosis TaxID=633 RepID=UPI0005E345B7|nr:helix-turn-helix transcriptional regulator [Yersinia pseudotuberculosis]CNC20777.1 putative DNA-binding protein [Yersinia pseudotuberculosis]